MIDLEEFQAARALLAHLATQLRTTPEGAQAAVEQLLAERDRLTAAIEAIKAVATDACPECGSGSPRRCGHNQENVNVE